MNKQTISYPYSIQEANRLLAGGTIIIRIIWGQEWLLSRDKATGNYVLTGKHILTNNPIRTFSDQSLERVLFHLLMQRAQYRPDQIDDPQVSSLSAFKSQKSREQAV